jgi:hypothetical protein
MFHADGRVRVCRRRGERLAPQCIQEVHPYGGGGMMVWGGICGDQKTRLATIQGTLTAQRYTEQVLQPVVLPFLRPGFILQQDNARPHTARITMDFFNRHNVDVLPWPAHSPDLSPIEHLWDHLGRQLRRRPHQPANLQELEQALQE